MPETSTSLAGRTLKWKFEDGPTAGTTYEHTFEAAGGVASRKVERGAAIGNGSCEYASFEVAPELLAEAGYTLTVALNFETGLLHGFASSDQELQTVSGTFET